MPRRTPRCWTAACSGSEGLRPVLPREPAERGELLRPGRLARRRSLTLNLGLRYEYVNAPKRSRGPHRLHLHRRRQQHRAAPRLRLRAGVGERVAEKLTGGPGKFSIRGGWGIYDGRLFQSIFSQGGANVRFNPPNALSRDAHDPAEHPQRLGSVARASCSCPVRRPARGADAAGPESRDAVHARSGTSASIARCRGARRCASSTRATTTTSGCATRRPTCRCLRSTGRYRRQSSQQRAGGRVSGSARQGHRSRSPPTRSAPAPGSSASRHRRLPERRADRRQRDQLARAAHERAAARSALHDQPADQQRRRELV